MTTYYLKPPNISWGLIFPFAWALMFFLRSQTTIGIMEILPGVMAISILFGTTSMLAVTITFERKSRAFERLLLAPISPNMLMGAKTSAAIFFGFLNSLIPLLVSSIWVDTFAFKWLIIFSAILLMSISSTLLGLLIAVSAGEVFEAQTFSNFFRFPMLFLSGLFIPLSDLPSLVQPLSHLIPLTYGVDLIKYSMGQNNHFNPLLAGILLMLLTIFLIFFSSRKWQQQNYQQ